MIASVETMALHQEEHYTCVVDLLRQVGFLNEAERLINKMPFEPEVVVWRTLLGVCTVHRNKELGGLM